VKGIVKSTIGFLAVIGAPGAVIAIASVANCGTPCTFVAEQAVEFTEALKKARAEKLTADISASTVQ
jgi:hypothetical protein